MEQLNKTSTEIFCHLIEAMKGGQHLKIYNEPFMPLTCEQVGTDISTLWGTGKLYSLCHYYEQNGDLMQDPEMSFIMVDNREEDKDDWDKVRVMPYMFQQANLAIYQESALIEQGRLTKFKRRQQADHTAFANGWLQNVKDQGFLKQLD